MQTLQRVQSTEQLFPFGQALNWKQPCVFAGKHNTIRMDRWSLQLKCVSVRSNLLRTIIAPE